MLGAAGAPGSPRKGSAAARATGGEKRGMNWGYSPRSCGDTTLQPALTLLRGRAQPGRPKAASLAVLSAHLPLSPSSPHGGCASQSFPQTPTSRSSPINITVDRVTPKQQGLTVFRIIFCNNDRTECSCGATQLPALAQLCPVPSSAPGYIQLRAA